MKQPKQLQHTSDSASMHLHAAADCEYLDLGIELLAPDAPVAHGTVQQQQRWTVASMLEGDAQPAAVDLGYPATVALRSCSRWASALAAPRTSP